MPLKQGSSKRTRQQNTRQLIREGRKPAQASAIARNIQRKAAAKKGKK